MRQYLYFYMDKNWFVKDDAELKISDTRKLEKKYMQKVEEVVIVGNPENVQCISPIIQHWENT